MNCLQARAGRGVGFMLVRACGEVGGGGVGVEFMFRLVGAAAPQDRFSVQLQNRFLVGVASAGIFRCLSQRRVPTTEWERFKKQRERL